MSIFRAYDIRGIYPTEVNEEFAENIGKAFGTFLLQSSGTARIAVGGDVRISTPALKSKVIEGILSTGADVIDIGMVTTPMLYFAVASLGIDGGMAVTASHNPKNYNGFKPVGKGGVCLSWETGIGAISTLITSHSFTTGYGVCETRNIEDDYIRHLSSTANICKKLTVVIDPANGACSIVAPKVFERLGCTVIRLFCEPDGTFPHHEANPVKKKNLASLQEKVMEVGADIGIAYDADGDRLGIVNEKGEIVENNTLFSLFIKDILTKTPGAPIVYEVVVSKVVEDTIRKFGGRPVLSRVGHSYIQSALSSNNAALAGENSGHYYFPENFGYDDAIFASIRAAELINTTQLSKREQEIPHYITSEEFRPFCADDRKFSAVATVQKQLRDAGYRLIDIDGARAVLDNGWFIIRASNTGPQLVVRWEAANNDQFGDIGTIVKEQLASVGVDLNE